MNSESARFNMVTVVQCPGPRFCGNQANQFVRSVNALSQAKPRVMLDMSDVKTLDVGGLLALASLIRVCHARGGVIGLCSPTRSVRTLLAAAGVHQMVDVYHTRQQAAIA